PVWGGAICLRSPGLGRGRRQPKLVALRLHRWVFGNVADLHPSTPDCSRPLQRRRRSQPSVSKNKTGRARLKPLSALLLEAFRAIVALGENAHETGTGGALGRALALWRSFCADVARSNHVELPCLSRRLGAWR